jgi:anti-sigma factor RsiW
MNEETHSETSPIGDCGRAGLLLSMAADGAATPQHLAELAAHLPGCEPCRRAQAADRAVRERLRERAGAGTPSWSAGFAERTVALALREAREARGQNRMLFACAAAAVLVAVTVQLVSPFGLGGDAAPRFEPGSGETASVQEPTKVALIRLQRLQRGK